LIRDKYFFTLVKEFFMQQWQSQQSNQLLKDHQQQSHQNNFLAYINVPVQIAIEEGYQL
jgi:hypothetical protein